MDLPSDIRLPNGIVIFVTSKFYNGSYLFIKSIEDKFA